MTVRPASSMVRVCGPLSFVDLGIAADRDDALAADRQRLGDGEAVVDGDDLAVDEDRVGAGVCAAAGVARSSIRGKGRDQERTHRHPPADCWGGC